VQHQRKSHQTHKLLHSLHKELFFQPLKQRLDGCRLDKNEEVEMASREWLRMEEPSVRGRSLKLVPRWGQIDQCALLIVLKNNRTRNELRLTV
jgi:hypothetical protein